MKSKRYFPLATFVVLLATMPVAAQSTTAAPAGTSRWAPWMGCWQVSEESIEDASQLLAQFSGAAAATATPRGARVCVTAPADGGAMITTLVNDTPVRTETVIADGTQRQVTEDGCRGWQKAEWAGVGAHLFAHAEISCGDQPLRTVSGMATMVAGPLWIDIQSIESQGKRSVRVRRYRPVAAKNGVASTARAELTMPLGKKLTIAEITEASAKVPTEVLQAAVIELGAGGFDLKAKQLRNLKTAGVAESVIDLLVAMSYPQRFVVERASSSGGSLFPGGWGEGIDNWSSMAMWPYAGMWPYYDDPFFLSTMSLRLYSPFYSAYYSPFGYRYLGYYDPRFRYYSDVGGFVVIDQGTGTTEPTAASGEGRVVDGRGYTRIRRTDPETPTRVNAGDGRGWTTASGGSSGSSGSSGSGSSGVSSGGYSGGGSSGSGGDRVAVPRPPGGN